MSNAVPLGSLGVGGMARACWEAASRLCPVEELLDAAGALLGVAPDEAISRSG